MEQSPEVNVIWTMPGFRCASRHQTNAALWLQYAALFIDYFNSFAVAPYALVIKWAYHIEQRALFSLTAVNFAKIAVFDS